MTSIELPAGSQMLAFLPGCRPSSPVPGHSTSAGLANRDFLGAALILTTDRATADMGQCR
jgi:hypothetical protein